MSTRQAIRNFDRSSPDDIGGRRIHGRSALHSDRGYHDTSAEAE
jgi:hypothetical protein